MTLREKVNQVTNGSRNVLIVCATVMFCFVMATAVAIVRVSHDDATALSLTVILLGTLAPTIAALAVVIKGESIKQTAQDTSDKMDRVLNGEMAAKIKTAYQEVMAERDKVKPPPERDSRGRRL